VLLQIQLSSAYLGGRFAPTTWQHRSDRGKLSTPKMVNIARPTAYARPRTLAPPPPPINRNIRADPVRLVAPKPGGAFGEEEMLGIYPLEEALEKAAEMELDLVLINEKADPPVCKIIDYGKYNYALERKKRDNAKKQVKGGLKEVKMSYKIDVHDFDVRVRAAHRFLATGDRVRPSFERGCGCDSALIILFVFQVKVIVQFKGREMQHKDLGQQLMTRYLTALGDAAVVENPPIMEGRSMFMLVAPKKGSPKRTEGKVKDKEVHTEPKAQHAA
jgi:translation initiation factor IF-3